MRTNNIDSILFCPLHQKSKQALVLLAFYRIYPIISFYFILFYSHCTVMHGWLAMQSGDC